MIHRLQLPSLSQHPHLGHGFYTRKGGVSQGLYQGLNGGWGSQDDPQCVEQNWSLVAQDMRLDDPHRLLSVKQVHGTTVVVVDQEQALFDRASRPEADGLVTNLCGVGLAVLTADCVPVLFADTTAGVIGAAHAGWKGALLGVLESTVQAMEALGAERQAIKAVIGPSIAQPSYQVGAQYREQFIDADRHNARFFARAYADDDNLVHNTPPHYQFNLPGYVEARLLSIGLVAVDWLQLDTYRDEENFFSFRRSLHLAQSDYGRQISCIVQYARRHE